MSDVDTSFPIATAQFVALYMQCIFYGIALVTVAYGLRVLLWSRDGHLKSRASINWVMIGTTVAMFIVATLELAVGFQQNLEAFIYYTGPGGPTGEFLDISNWLSVAKVVDYVVQMMIGDTIMLYRCYVIYNYDWKIVAIPVFLWFAEIGCGWMVIYITATLHSGITMNTPQLVPYVVSGLSLTLVMTILMTGLIVHRILKINASVDAPSITRLGENDRLIRVARVLVESGFLYTVSVFIFFCTFLTSNNAQYGVSDVIVQLIPISFTLILIRLDRGTAVETPTIQQSTIRQPVMFSVTGSGNARADVSRSRGIAVSGMESDSYMADDIESGCNPGWKAGQYGLVPV
ncbi:hypothetical protein L226DRAFT_609464 [Lentinus tigrinus ALCF2SS1-7]|uniref:Uncharacterized protein n=1 Tax=Lentinus tigrinus ALCF2SS1-6 TaxID=1328759 RepID=A0A5C2SQ20_9APHY|nr:hypothetical protein L227DRAFT_649756 [Lentinus tigrinus ALCF2SS1-6]RPD78855.1 hypothetical protein L226DRAFT_609464 [Lentinus tigrinus ALCF2SS1-7]